MATEEKLYFFLKKLKEATVSKRLLWTSTVDGFTFRVSLKAGSVTIENDRGYDEGGHLKYHNGMLRIYDRKGLLVEEYTPEFNDVSAVKEFEILFDVARRSALNTASVLDDLIGEI